MPKPAIKDRKNVGKLIDKALKNQQDFFSSGATLDRKFRDAQLKNLKAAIKRNEGEIFDALHSDLRKPKLEAYLSEIGFLYEDIKHVRKHLRSWMKPERMSTPLTIPFSSSKVLKQPHGVVLVISPWNYPLQLLFSPLVGAIAAGNCAILKPSELAPAISKVMTSIIAETFPEEYVTVIEGGVQTSKELLKKNWDYIFFTGGPGVGRIVAEAAAKKLIPYTLELGGKSPVIVDRGANLKLAARRITWAKFFNAGQSCTAPDYLLAHSSIKDELLSEIRNCIESSFPNGPQQSDDYGRIVNDGNFDRVAKMIKKNTVVIGGDIDKKDLYIAPTILDGVTMKDRVMKEEIFGPLLPVMTFESLNDIKQTIGQLPDPLALYIFSEDSEMIKKVTNQIPFGGGCVNNCLTHSANPNLPFGGIRNSGNGAYHGKYSFDTFSHHKGILRSSSKVDGGIQYQPYGNKLNLVKKVIR